MTIEIPVKDKLLLSVEEAAAYCGIGQKLMRQLLATDLQDAVVRIGSHTKVRRKDLEDFIELWAGYAPLQEHTTAGTAPRDRGRCHG